MIALHGDGVLPEPHMISGVGYSNCRVLVRRHMFVAQLLKPWLSGTPGTCVRVGD